MKRSNIFPRHSNYNLPTAIKGDGCYILDNKQNLIIMSAHPSPYSAHFGFFGSQPFSKANSYLKKTGQAEIIW